MGTPAAPVLANVYAASIEEQLPILKHARLLYYGRYLDDIFLMYKGSEEELKSFLAQVKLGSLTISWSYSQTTEHFLDVEVLRYKNTSMEVWTLATKLFVKPMNRHLYIPWSSAHPQHVKKAFVKAELTRFVILCSEMWYFADARRAFYSNLRRRGYPSRTLDVWFTQASYSQRMAFLTTFQAESHVDDMPLMLRGEYNPIWEYINVDEISKAAQKEWSKLKDQLPRTLQQKLIRSLRKSTCLGDLLNVSNLTALEQYYSETRNNSAASESAMPGTGLS